MKRLAVPYITQISHILRTAQAQHNTCVLCFPPPPLCRLFRLLPQPTRPTRIRFRSLPLPLLPAWCPYCQKVWLQLEEKRIPYKIEWINMRRATMRIRAPVCVSRV